MATQQLSISTIEQVLVTGDLARMSVEQRVEYHNLVCKSLGLNPLTRPFNFLVLNGKTVLYATRDCTDQLRKINSVSILSLDSKIVGDLIVVTVSAKDKQERTDFATGVVNTKSLVGADLANAMMKAETKAKRRVTLSLCGLGMLDESEIEPDEAPRGGIQREPGALPLPAPKPNGNGNGKSKVQVCFLKGNVAVISGNTYFMKDYSKSVGATVLKNLDGSMRGWQMSSGRVHELFALCEQLRLECEEVDETGKFIPEALEVTPQVPLD